MGQFTAILFYFILFCSKVLIEFGLIFIFSMVWFGTVVHAVRASTFQYLQYVSVLTVRANGSVYVAVEKELYIHFLV